MKTKHKGIYQPPTSSVVEMNMQGMLCWSDQQQFIILGVFSPNQDGVQNYTYQGDQNW